LATCRQSPLWSGSWSCVALLEASWPLRIPSLCSGIYTYVCVCVYIHMYVRVCICRYIYIYEYMYTCILVRGHVLHCCRPLRVPSLCPGIYIYMCLCAYTYSYIHIYTYTYIYISVRGLMLHCWRRHGPCVFPPYAQVYTYVCVCVYMYIYISVRGHVSHCWRPSCIPSVCSGIYICIYMQAPRRLQQCDMMYAHRPLHVDSLLMLRYIHNNIYTQ